MKMKLYSVYDTKACVYHPPVFLANVATAMRWFFDVVNDSQTALSKHPADYVLYEIGDYDDNTGVVSSQPFVNLGNAVQFVELRPGKEAPEDLKRIAANTGEKMRFDLLKETVKGKVG